jgi:hypothetical protein
MKDTKVLLDSKQKQIVNLKEEVKKLMQFENEVY